MKKNSMKKFAAALAALCLTSAFAVPTMEAYAGTIEITDATNVAVNGKTFDIYQLFSMTQVGTAVKYTVNSQWADFFTQKYDAYYNALEDKTGFESIYTDAEKTKVKTGDDYTMIIATWMNYIGENDPAYVRTLANALEKEATKTDSPYTKKSSAELLANTSGTGDSATLSADKKTLTLNVADGYYLILDTTDVYGDDTAASASILKSTGDQPTSIALKADKPGITKKIWNKDTNNDKIPDTNELVDANTACIGDTVKYVLEGTIPSADKLALYDKYYYQIVDELSKGLDYASVDKVTVGGIEVSENLYKVEYNASADGGRILTVTFTNLHAAITDVTTKAGSSSTDDIIYDAAAGVDVIFSATVNTDAEIGSTGNPNRVYLRYSNDPSQTGDGTTSPSTPPDADNPNPDNPNKPDEPSLGSSPVDTVITYLTQLKIKKVDGEDNDLAGAKFSIQNVNGTTKYYVKTTYDEKGNVTKTELQTVTDKGNATTVTDAMLVESDEYGNITFTGLAAGTYIITEEEAPGAYNRLTTPIKVNITCDLPAVNTDDATKIEVTSMTDKCKWTATPEGYNDYATDAEGVITLKVVNKTGALFPSTGGMGTTLFTVLGVSMMAGAAGLYVVKRKVSNK
ncbi:MAG: isopeptide-forming domain-containing fimbrial protein [Ruminococcus sp.]|nr:isopeptide-forming domain-containing fimbrial protein [Ruminococcus sp.]